MFITCLGSWIWGTTAGWATTTPTLSLRKSAGRRMPRRWHYFFHLFFFFFNNDILGSSFLFSRQANCRGLRVLGMEPGKPLCIFADTRAEWMVSAQACFRSVLTSYSTYYPTPPPPYYRVPKPHTWLLLASKKSKILKLLLKVCTMRQTWSFKTLKPHNA